MLLPSGSQMVEWPSDSIQHGKALLSCWQRLKTHWFQAILLLVSLALISLISFWALLFTTTWIGWSLPVLCSSCTPSESGRDGWHRSGWSWRFSWWLRWCRPPHHQEDLYKRIATRLYTHFACRPHCSSTQCWRVLHEFSLEKNKKQRIGNIGIWGKTLDFEFTKYVMWKTNNKVIYIVHSGRTYCCWRHNPIPERSDLSDISLVLLFQLLYDVV